MFRTGHNLTTEEVLNLPLTDRSRYLKHVRDSSPGKHAELTEDMARLRLAPLTPTKETLERLRARRKERERQEHKRRTKNEIEDLERILDPVELSPKEKELLRKKTGLDQLASEEIPMEHIREGCSVPSNELLQKAQSVGLLSYAEVLEWRRVRKSLSGLMQALVAESPSFIRKRWTWDEQFTNKRSNGIPYEPIE